MAIALRLCTRFEAFCTTLNGQQATIAGSSIDNWADEGVRRSLGKAKAAVGKLRHELASSKLYPGRT